MMYVFRTYAHSQYFSNLSSLLITVFIISSNYRICIHHPFLFLRIIVFIVPYISEYIIIYYHYYYYYIIIHLSLFHLFYLISPNISSGMELCMSAVRNGLPSSIFSSSSCTVQYVTLKLIMSDKWTYARNTTSITRSIICQLYC